MKIVHLSTHDIAGGAAQAAWRLHKGLGCLGHDSTMFVKGRRSDDPKVTNFTPVMALPNRLHRCLRQKWILHSLARYRTSFPSHYEIFSDDRTQYGASLLSQLPSCDVINLHWVAGFVDYRPFFTVVPQHTSVVWTLHDMTAFTGGCHYDHGCGRYVDGCGACPQLGSNKKNDLSRQIWQRKRAIFEQLRPSQLHLVAPSHWIADQAKRSALLGDYPVTVIPYGLDTDDFAPRDRRFARKVLGLSQDARVVLFVSESTHIQRKGFHLLAQALANLNTLPNLTLISLGHGKPAIDIDTPCLSLSHITNHRLLSLVYSAADLFVIPSLQDNLPNTVLESMACGTPVVGFAVGGICDMVRHDITGLLVPPQDVVGLRIAIVELLQDEVRLAKMSASCRSIVMAEYGMEMQAQCYIELYQKLVASSERDC